MGELHRIGLRTLGKQFGATGEAEEIAVAMQQLATESTARAAEAPSEAYEAHAVIVNLKRKQQDSAAAMLKIARAQRNTEVRDAASEFLKAQKASAQLLADRLAAFAVVIATDGKAETARPGRTQSGARGSSRKGS